MTQTLGFGWTYSDASNYVITEFLADGTSRTVTPQYELYLAWIAAGNTPVQIAGNQYVTFPSGVPTYNSTQAAADALAAGWSAVRAKRNLLLAQCDWIMLSDGPIFANALQLVAWKTYRTALRNLPATYGAPTGDPTKVVWPTQPSVVEPSPI